TLAARWTGLRCCVVLLLVGGCNEFSIPVSENVDVIPWGCTACRRNTPEKRLAKAPFPRSVGRSLCTGGVHREGAGREFGSCDVAQANRQRQCQPRFDG